MGGEVGQDTDASTGIDVMDNSIVAARAKVFVAWSPGADYIGGVALGANAADFASRATGVGIVFVGGGGMID